MKVLERLVNIAERERLLEYFVAIHFDKNLRHIRQVRGNDSRKFGRFFAASDELLRFGEKTKRPASRSDLPRIKVKPPDDPTPGIEGVKRPSRLLRQAPSSFSAGRESYVFLLRFFSFSPRLSVTKKKAL